MWQSRRRIRSRLGHTPPDASHPRLFLAVYCDLQSVQGGRDAECVVCAVGIPGDVYDEDLTVGHPVWGTAPRPAIIKLLFRLQAVSTTVCWALKVGVIGSSSPRQTVEMSHSMSPVFVPALQKSRRSIAPI